MVTNSTATPAPLLRRLSNMPAEALLSTVLKIDAAVTGINGLAYLVVADLLEAPLGVSPAVLRPLGASLLVFAGVVWQVASRRPIRPKPVALVIAMNILWVVDSLLALAVGWLTPTTASALWAVAQAAVVAGFAVLQCRALVSSARRP
jgi:hypothetical protein